MRARLTAFLAISAIFITAAAIFFNFGCGGGGGDSSTTPSGQTPVTGPQTVEITGRVGAQSPAIFPAPDRQTDYQSFTTIQAVDENGEKFPGATASYRGLNSFIVTVPVGSESRFLVIEVRDSKGRALYKNFAGKIPRNSDVSASVIKVSGMRINEDTSARTVLLLSEKSRIPDTYIATSDVFETTDFEKDATSVINDPDGTRVVTPLVTAVKTVLGASDPAYDSYRSSFLKSVDSLLSAYADIVKATQASTSILVGGRIISAQSDITGADLADISSKVRNELVAVVSKPLFSPAPGNYQKAQTITIYSNTPGASIMFTQDGTAPSQTNGSLYSGPFQLSTSATIKAVAFRSGSKDSEISTANYIVTGPLLSPLVLDRIEAGTPSGLAGNIYTNALGALNQTIISPVPYVELFFKRADDLSFTLSNETLKIRLTVSSSRGTAAYVYNFTPSAEEYSLTDEFYPPVKAASSVKITLRETSALFYDNAAYTIAITALEGVSYSNAEGQSKSYTLADNVNGVITVTGVDNKLQAPVISPAGGTFTSPQTVSITHPTAGAVIRYTLDGVAPSSTVGIVYSGPITISGNATVKAVASKSGRTDSDASSASFVIRAASPVFDPPAGAYDNAQTVSMTTTTAGASIYFTENGSIPTIASTLYTGPLLVTSTRTINAVAIKTGLTSSDVSTAAYVIQAKAPAVISVKEKADGSGSELIGNFSANTMSYNVNISTSITGVKVTATLASGTTMRVVYKGADKAGGSVDPLDFGANTITAIVSEDGKTDRTYTFNVSRQELSAGLTALSVKNGSSALALTPGFSQSTLSYTASVPSTVSSVTVTPTADNGSITVNGTLVASGNASSPINLSYGSNTITVTVTETGKTAKTYTVAISRQEQAAGLTALIVRDNSSAAVPLTPAFAQDTLSYSANVGNAVSSVTLTPTAPAGTIKINGATVTSGQASGAINLNFGANTITAVVSENGKADKSYTFTISRQDQAAGLTSLSVKDNTNAAVVISPAFAQGTLSYTASVAYAITSVSFTPAASNSSILVNGTTTASGSQSAPVALNVGSNNILITVSEAGKLDKVYTVTVTRQGQAAGLTALSIKDNTNATVTLAPSFSQTVTTYTAAVANTITSITVTPTGATGNTITVNGTAVASGQASNAINLALGANTVTIVTSEAGKADKTYVITVSRQDQAAGLTNLTLKDNTNAVVALAPGFANATQTYAASVVNTVTAVVATPTVASGTIKINNTTVSSGGNFTLNLSVGDNVLTIVTSETGKADKTYTVTVTKQGQAAGLTALSIKDNANATVTFTPAFAQNTLSYAASVGNSIVSVTVTPTAATGTITVNGAAVTSGQASNAINLNQGANTVTIVVSENGKADKTYTVAVNKSAVSAGLTGLVVKDNNSTTVSLTPAFAQAELNYAASVANAITSVTVTPTVSAGSITVNGTNVQSGNQSSAITLSIGANTVTIVVTESGKDPKTYKVIVDKAGAFAMTSPDIINGQPIDNKFVSAIEGGLNKSPELNWTGVPPDAKSLLLVCIDDMTTPTNAYDDVVHWLVYNVPTTTTGISQAIAEGSIINAGLKPSGTANHGKNTFNQSRYDGPGAPDGSNPPVGVQHTYHYILLATKDATVFPPDQNIYAFISVLQDQSKIAGKVELTALFTGK